jgi:excinuclease ABC subunit C
VEQVLEKQKIINTTGADDQDVIALAGEGDETCAQVFFFRGGRLTGREFFILQGTRDTSESEIMQMFIQQFYDQAPHVPGELILAGEPENAEALRAWLRQKRGAAVTLTIPQRGDKLRLVAMVAQNAREALEQQRIKWLSDSQKTALALDELRDMLNLPAPPRRIECYDISNTQGTNSVGSMVVLENGRPKSSDYRRFKVKTIEGANDVGSLQEVLGRRFKRMAVAEDGQPNDAPAEVEAEAESEVEQVEREAQDGDAPANEEGVSPDMLGDPWAQIPDLVIVDGGRPQLNAAVETLAALDVRVPVIGIAKENHGSISTYEEIYLMDQPEPVVLPRASQGLYLLQRVRDEAHRFAITYHRNLRSARTFRSVLDDIPGIGPKRKKALVRHFGSARAIAAASVEDIAAVDGMNRDLAERVKEFIGSGRAIGPEDLA